MKKSSTFSPEVRERAVRCVFEHQGEHESQWVAICSIASKIGGTAETLHRWVRQTEHDQGQWNGLIRSEQEQLQDLERENRELQRINEMLSQSATIERICGIRDCDVITYFLYPCSNVIWLSLT